MGISSGIPLIWGFFRSPMRLSPRHFLLGIYFSLCLPWFWCFLPLRGRSEIGLGEESLNCFNMNPLLLQSRILYPPFCMVLQPLNKNWLQLLIINYFLNQTAIVFILAGQACQFSLQYLDISIFFSLLQIMPKGLYKILWQVFSHSSRVWTSLRFNGTLLYLYFAWRVQFREV